MSSKVVFFILWGLLLAACGANTEPLVVTFVPSATPDALSLPTLAASTTPTIEIRPTVTLAPTDTPRPTVPNAQATRPLLPTFTLAPATQTATFAPQAAATIEYFITNEERLRPNGNVTLLWRVTGATGARIFQLNNAGRRTQVWEVPAEGRLTVSADTSEGTALVRFLLLAQTASGGTLEQNLEITAGDAECSIAWFFVPVPENCPLEPPILMNQVEQRFEGGLLLWLENSSEILVFYDDDNEPSWERFPDTFVEGVSPVQDDTIVAPPERLQPIRGFGLVWREQPEVRARLGWAMEPELGYDGTMQVSEDNTLYLRERTGGIIAARPNSWEILPLSAAAETVPTATTTPEN